MRVRFPQGPLPHTEWGVFDYVITIGIVAISINLFSSISFQPMNYKDALNVSISDKLTKSKLIEIANTLQDRCLLSELDKPTLIPLNSYIKDVRSRWDIHLTEWRALTKDIINVGKQARVIYDRAYARAFDWFFPLALRG